MSHASESHTYAILSVSRDRERGRFCLQPVPVAVAWLARSASEKRPLLTV